MRNEYSSMREVQVGTATPDERTVPTIFTLCLGDGMRRLEGLVPAMLANVQTMRRNLQAFIQKEGRL